MEKSKILEATLQLFLRFGIKSVTTDDIAKSLGISKKTLYQHFPNKKELVFQTLSFYINLEKQAVEKISEKAENAIEEILKTGEFVCEYLGNFNPAVIYDMRKYYPKAWKAFQEYKEDYLLNIIKDNILKGIKQNLYRNNINVDIIARIYVSKVEAMIDESIFPGRQFDKKEIIREVQLYHLHGIADEKGFRYLEKMINKT